MAEEGAYATKGVASHDHEIGKKICHAEKVGITIKEIEEGEEVPEDFRFQTDNRIQDWLPGCKGKQVHIFDSTPWRDMMHRPYVY